MKTAGWIILVIAVLSFMGAALKGHSVFGPCFWIAVGGYLLYRANTKKEKEETLTKADTTASTIQTQIKDNLNVKESQKTVVALEKLQEEKETETIGEIQSQMTLQQREAAMCLVALFGGYANKMPREAMTFISSQAATFFGIPFNETAISGMLARYSDADKLIDTVITIKQRKAKEFLLLTCHDFVNNSSSREASLLLENIAADMGYNNHLFRQLVNTYNSQ